MRSAVLVIALAHSAAAEPPGIAAPVPAAAPSSEPSYRLQTATVDGIAIGLTTLAFSTNNDAAGYTGIGTYLLGAPIVHLVHDRPGRAAVSFGLRVALPLAGAAIGDKQGGCHGDVCDSGQAGLGLFAGMVAATVIDTLWLAEGDETPARASWSPSVSAGRGGASLGLAGTF